MWLYKYSFWNKKEEKNSKCKYKCLNVLIFFFVVDVEIFDVSNSEVGKKSMILFIYYLWI